MKNIFIKSDEIVLMMFYPVIELVRLFSLEYITIKIPSLLIETIHHILYEKKFSNKKIQIILLLINTVPLLIYEITQINILLFVLVNSLVYYLIVSKNKFLFPYNNK